MLKEELALATQRKRVMRVEERLAQLEAENAVLHEQIKRLLVSVAENATLREQVSRLQERLAELEGRLAKDSHTSSKPPSSDGMGRKPHSQRKASGKKSGGQRGHAGHSLQMAEKPDTIVTHCPSECTQCQQPLEGVVGQIVDRRQVQDLPVWQVVVSEHGLSVRN